jgi:hypothetical protein
MTHHFLNSGELVFVIVAILRDISDKHSLTLMVEKIRMVSLMVDSLSVRRNIRIQVRQRYQQNDFTSFTDVCRMTDKPVN